MAVSLASAALLLALAYLALGLVFAIPFALAGASRLDDGARGAPWGFRLIIIPGAAALWPVLLVKFLRPRRPAGDPAPARALRRTHLTLWLALGPACVALLFLALAARPPHPHDQPPADAAEPRP